MKSQLKADLICISVLLCNLNCTAQILYLTPGGHFVANGNLSLVVNNSAIRNNGSFNCGSCTIYFTGNSDTTASYIIGDSTTSIANLNINNSLHGMAVKGPVWITNVLTMTSGNLYANSQLTLISSLTNTARVAAVPSYCTIAGKANVQRFIPGHRAWRLLTAPVTVSNTIYNAWQNGGVYTPGIGTLITKPNPSGSDGLDAGLNANYSMKTFNQSGQSWVNVSNTKVNIAAGNNGSADNTAYMIFIRGDRNPATVGNPLYSTLPCANTTLSCLGNLQQGDQTFSTSSVGGKYSLVGNPYAAPIDFNNVTRTNLIKRFYIWDPALNFVGGFVVLDDILNTGTFASSVPSSKQGKDIQSGQAFFVQTLSNGSSSLKISESSKSTTNNTLIFRPMNNIGSIIANLYLYSDSAVSLADAATVQYNEQFNAALDWQDANKLANINEGLGILSGATTLAIERRPGITANDTIFLKLTGTSTREYQLEFIAVNINHPALNGILVDNYLGTQTPVSLSGNTKINFSVVQGNAASAASNRFMVIFKPAGIVPVTFTSNKAYQANKDVMVNWKVANQINIDKYEVERSADGINFTKTNITVAINTSSADYTWMDKDPLTGNNYYRIKSIDKNGNISYSLVMLVTIENSTSQIIVSPNPISGNVINLFFSHVQPCKSKLQLINSAGQTVISKNISISDNNMQKIVLRSKPAAGNYELKITSVDNKIIVLKVIVQ